VHAARLSACAVCWQGILPIVLSVLILMEIYYEARNPFGAVDSRPHPANATNSSSSSSTASTCRLSELDQPSNATSMYERLTNGSGASPADDAGAAEDVSPFPPWATGLGWFLALGPVCFAPCCALGHAIAQRGKPKRPLPREVALSVLGFTSASTPATTGANPASPEFELA
jgi:hypothetical protein